jgi:very-short-patch-repair endonuclease
MLGQKMPKLKSFYDIKSLKNLNFTECQKNELEILHNKTKIKKIEYKMLSKLINFGVEDLCNAFFRYRQVSELGESINDHKHIIYIYGDVIGKKVIESRNIKSKITRTKESDPLRQLLKQPKFIKENIIFENLSDKQIQRITNVLVMQDHELIDNWQTKIINFIKLDLTNYSGRLRRLKKYYENGSGFSLLTFVLTYGKKQGVKLYNEANYRRVHALPSRLNKWIDMGFNLDEAKDLISKTQKIKAQKAAAKLKNTSEYSIRSVVYWRKLGMSEDEAKKKVYEIQTHVWRKYTDDERRERIRCWLETLNSKTEEEKKLINFKKGHSPESYMLSKNISYEEALQLSINYYSKRNFYSKVSQDLFWKIVDMIGTEDIYFASLNYEKQIGGKCVDFIDTKTGIIIEFDGDFWHANPKMYESTDLIYGKTAKEIWNNDKKREDHILRSYPNGKIIRVWYSEYLQNVDFTVNMLCERIQIERKLLNE